MDLQNILTDFFIRNGSLFTLDDDVEKTAFYGRLTPCKNSEKSDNAIISPLGKSKSKDYEIVFSGEISCFKKGLTLKSDDKAFCITSINKYPLNGKTLYCHAFLHELGGIL